MDDTLINNKVDYLMQEVSTPPTSAEQFKATAEQPSGKTDTSSNTSKDAEINNLRQKQAKYSQTKLQVIRGRLRRYFGVGNKDQYANQASSKNESVKNDSIENEPEARQNQQIKTTVDIVASKVNSADSNQEESAEFVQERKPREQFEPSEKGAAINEKLATNKDRVETNSASEEKNTNSIDTVEPTIVSEKVAKTSENPLKPENIDLTELTGKITRLLDKSKSYESGFYPSEPLTVGGHNIESNTALLVYDPINKVTTLNFKLRESVGKTIREEVVPKLPLDQVKQGFYDFPQTIVEPIMSNDGKNVVDDGHDSGGIEITVNDDTVMHIATGTKKFVNDDGVKEEEHVAGLENLVLINIDGINPAAIASNIKQSLEAVNLEKALLPLTEKEIAEYKAARYRWQHKIGDDNEWQTYQDKYKADHGIELLDVLQMQEVYPGYETVVEPEASERYKKEGEFYLSHVLRISETANGYTNLANILSKTGLLSVQQQRLRGQWFYSVDARREFDKGGADNVFVSYNTSHISDRESWFGQKGMTLIINPNILDRTDWFAYGSREFGSREAEVFASRPTPEQFMQQQQTELTDNEMMFRYGIPPSTFQSLVVQEDDVRDRMVIQLHEKGIHEVSGKLIEDFIVVCHTPDEMRKFALTNNEDSILENAA